MWMLFCDLGRVHGNEYDQSDQVSVALSQLKDKVDEQESRYAAKLQLCEKIVIIMIMITIMMTTMTMTTMMMIMMITFLRFF